MKRAIGFLVLLVFLSMAATVSGAGKDAKEEGVCAAPAENFRFMPELRRNEGSPVADLKSVPQPTGKGQNRVTLEANDDLAAVSLKGGAISPYVGASVDLLPLPNYDPETTTTQVLAYGLGAGFGCDLGSSTRLSLGYQIRFFENGSLSEAAEEDEEETHRFSFGLQKSF